MYQKVKSSVIVNLTCIELELSEYIKQNLTKL